eukprot:CAMPEP_0176343556 /NCGR_PEP_ID=MMETSP0126-20121128/4036_1 /TAXON_ID=141414 ORGANISM="Strombidinopsis acuminatum, Strain SPMC142" /NCGR_SAMPLE_ID=MMETSP0126 /ASSEMBLY_ACC=CAM_ASM_000229 /LENGTH=157 /DNA_ID=CAMNT_0017689571 /DNA_START=2967 /DNA_END=3440 /DNA_ORIENTATION=-
MPFVQFSKDPRDIFYLLKDISDDYVTKILACSSQKTKYADKLNNEFYVVCLLNALFGNPNISLVQMHPSCKSNNIFERQVGLFGKKSLQDESAIVISKKRKNAVAEVYRFICQQEFPVDQRASVYDKAYNMLLNGDIKGAVKHLTWEKKHKLAMFVA